MRCYCGDIFTLDVAGKFSVIVADPDYNKDREFYRTAARTMLRLLTRPGAIVLAWPADPQRLAALGNAGPEEFAGAVDDECADYESFIIPWPARKIAFHIYHLLPAAPIDGAALQEELDAVEAQNNVHLPVPLCRAIIRHMPAGAVLEPFAWHGTAAAAAALENRMATAIEIEPIAFGKLVAALRNVDPYLEVVR